MRNPADPALRLPEATSGELQSLVQQALTDRALLQGQHGRAVREVIDRLDKGTLRVAERVQTGERWKIHGWLQ